ncbi:MAG: MucBP domain-containing protein, partial [Clostridia bacterium]|nr:MucBP domain-containing protein [Clostridia bacterium]
KAEAKIDILAPTSLITMETITDYDETTDSEITIAPNVALVNRDERQAKINIHLTNNYTNEISNVRILGKIPYENNTYIINDVNLKSEFTTEMTSNGVNIPEELPNDIKQNTTVYYSTKENPTKDLQNAENGWKTKEKVEDWSEIKSYLICINDCKIASGQEVKFNYDVTLPENVTLNMAAFSTHAVYFNLDTEDGMIKLYTEPTKVGVRIVKKYVLDLTKYKLNSSVIIPGVTYSLKYSVKNAEGDLVEKQSILTTDENGKIVLQGLFAGIEYTLKEVKAPVECELNDGEIKFIVDENDSLTVTGITKDSSYIETDNVLKIDLENEIKAKIQINKYKKDTNIKINNVYFEAESEDGEHLQGKTKDGFVEIPGVSLGKVYTLREIATPNAVEKNNGEFKFRLTRQGLTEINIEVLESSLLKDEYILENNANEICPVIKVNVEDEIRYNININKIDNEGNAIKNVKFEISEENSESKVAAQTSASGECLFSRLSLNKTYILKEISATGYFIDGENDYITIKVERDGTLQITKFETNGNITVIGNPVLTEDGVNANLNITLENEKIPTYDLKIIKKNEEGYTLSGARFKLKRVFDGKEVALKVDENGEGIFEGLFEDIEGKNVTGEYELVETFSPEGYRLNSTPLKFSATRDAEGKLVFKTIEGGDTIRTLLNSDEKEISSDEDVVTIAIVNKPIFSLIKTGDNGVLLPNAKFIITDLQNNPATDAYGNIIGEYDETTNRYLITTDSEGKISVNLSKGVYKATEVEAPEGYSLPVNLEDRIFYFGIDESQDATYSDYRAKLGWTKEIENENLKYNSIFAAIDNGVIVYGTNENNNMLIKFDSDGEIEWSKEMTTATLCDFKIIDDESYELVVKCKTSEYWYDEHSINTVQDKDNYVIVKLDSDGDYISISNFDMEGNTKYVGQNDQGNIIIQNNVEIIEYNKQGIVQNQFNLGTSNNSVVRNNSNGYLAVSGRTVSFFDNNGTLKWTKSLELMEEDDGYVDNGSYGMQNVFLNNDNEFVVLSKMALFKYGTYYMRNYIRVDIFDDAGNVRTMFKYNCDGHSWNPMQYPGIKSINYKNISFIDNDGNEKNGFIIIYNNYDLSDWEHSGFYVYDNDLNYLWGVNEEPYTRFCNVYDVEKVDNNYFVFRKYSTQYQFLKYEGIQIYPEIAAAQEINVNNELKKYDITTEIGQNSNYLRIGGTVTGYYKGKYESGNYIKFVEDIKHGNDSEQDIIIEPDEGYFVHKVTIDGEKVDFETDETGKVIIPSGYFENVTENHHIVVIFERKSLAILIKKEDENGHPLKGAKFEVKSESGSTYTSELTNEQGEVFVEVGSYTSYKIKEIQAPENYVLSDETKTVTLSETNNDEVSSVTFVNIEKPTITIEKTDENNNPIKGAKFKINTVNSKPEIGELTGVGPDYISKDEEAEYIVLSDEMINKDNMYYFSKTVEGKYIPNNMEYYNRYTTAWSCMKIDLTASLEDYILKVEITKNLLSSDTFQMYVSESEDSSYDQSTKTFSSENECVLNKGKVYYLHFRFTRGGYTDSRTLSVDSIKLFKTKKENFYFTEQDGVYEPNNSYVPFSTARSYIPLNLTNCNGKYEVKVNAQTKATDPDSDRGRVYITESLDFDDTEKTLIYWGNWQSKADDYKTTIKGGKQYYIVMEYVRQSANKTSVSDIPNDFRINSISISEVGGEFTGETDSQGKWTVHLEEIGKFVIKEIEAPEGYVLDDRQQEVTLTADDSYQTVYFINRKKTKVIVHHYLEGTGEEFGTEPVVLAEEETVEGKSGTPYTTAPNMEIEKYTLIKNEDGTYKLPSNATGTFTDEVQNVYYYYNTAPVKLVVHHYLEGTEDTLADDENSTYEKGDHYKTTPSAEVLETYDLVRVMGDEEKDITQDEEVTYYYVKKQHKITTRVETISYFGKPEKGGEITGEDEKPYETVPHGNSNTKEIK